MKRRCKSTFIMFCGLKRKAVITVFLFYVKFLFNPHSYLHKGNLNDFYEKKCIWTSLYRIYIYIFTLISFKTKLKGTQCCL